LVEVEVEGAVLVVQTDLSTHAVVQVEVEVEVVQQVHLTGHGLVAVRVQCL
jgi:hypothetical protein